MNQPDERTTPHDVVDEPRLSPDRAGADDLLYGARVAVWVRYFVLLTWFAQMNYRVDFADPNYVPNSAFAGTMLALNGYVHYRILTNRRVTWRWLLTLSVMDAVMITAGLTISSGFQNSFFVLYYPALAMFAVVFTSSRLSFAVVTLVASAYVTLSLAAEPGVDFALKEEKALYTRIVVMYAVVGAVNLVSRSERIRRREAVERERELQRERIELSQTMHDTIAQSTYMIGIGIETAIELASDREGAGLDEILAKLYATHALSKSTMWELRHSIDAGPLFEGRGLSRVLRSHASTFATVASVPAEMIQSGHEPPLPTLTRQRLFSIAHNAMTNALRHAQASKVTVSLDFEDDGLRMSVSDDGVGLSEDYAGRGHGFRNMQADAERMGGHLEVTPGRSGRGTTVTCVVPYDTHRRGT